MHLSTFLYGTSILIGAVVGLGAILAGVSYLMAQWQQPRDNKSRQDCSEAIESLQGLVSGLQGQNKLQAGQIQEAIDERAEQAKEILELKTTVNNIKDIPLEKIEQHMATTNDILQKMVDGNPKVVVNNAAPQ